MKTLGYFQGEGTRAAQQRQLWVLLDPTQTPNTVITQEHAHNGFIIRIVVDSERSRELFAQRLSAMSWHPSPAEEPPPAG